MKIFVFFIFYLFIVYINGDVANFNTVQQFPKTNIYLNSNQFIFEINQTVNRPSFPAFIKFFLAANNSLIYQIDVSNSTYNVTYTNYTLIFYLSNSTTFRINDEFYITFDAGVLFSNITNSTAQTDNTFWHLLVIDIETSTSVTNTMDNTSMGSTYTATTYSDTSELIVSAITTYSSVNTPTVSPEKTSPQGESSPTRSAQLGMGLGITFITVIIVGEILYFKFCYHDHGRSGSYYT